MRKLQTILYYLFPVVILSYFAAAIYCKDFGIIMHNKAVILTLFFVWSLQYSQSCTLSLHFLY